MDTFETRGNKISEPLIAGNFFSLAMHVEVTDKKSSTPISMCEIAVFEVKDDKIVAEQSFFDQPPET